MRKFMMLGALVALVVAALALPALAQQNRDQDDQEDRFDARQDRFEERQDRFEERFFFEEDFFEDDFFGEDGFFFGDDRFNEDDFDGNGFDGNNNGGNGGVSQDNEQDVESGDAEQSFVVSGGGDNSNACQNVQGINNTGNAVSNTSVLQYANEDAEVDVEDSGNFTISPQTAVECDQQVNQAATAFGGK